MTQPARPTRRRQALLAGAAAVAVVVVAVAAVSAGADEAVLTVGPPAGSPAAPAAGASPTADGAAAAQANEAAEPAATAASPTATTPTAPAAAPSQAPAETPAEALPAPGSPSKAPASPAPRTARAVLEGEGLGFAGGSSTRRLTFAEADAATVQEAVRRAVGEGRTSQQPDCGPGLRAYDAGGLRLLLSGERFLGWSVQGTTSGSLATADGIGVGTTLAQLRASRSQVEVRDSTVGTRWTAGGLSGLLDGDDSTSRITLIAAGQTCNFD